MIFPTRIHFICSVLGLRKVAGNQKLRSYHVDRWHGVFLCTSWPDYVAVRTVFFMSFSICFYLSVLSPSFPAYLSRFMCLHLSHSYLFVCFRDLWCGVIAENTTSTSIGRYLYLRPLCITCSWLLWRDESPAIFWPAQPSVRDLKRSNEFWASQGVEDVDVCLPCVDTNVSKEITASIFRASAHGVIMQKATLKQSWRGCSGNSG